MISGSLLDTRPDFYAGACPMVERNMSDTAALPHCRTAALPHCRTAALPD